MNIVLNGEAKEIDPGTTIADLLRSLEMVGTRIAVEVNRDIVPRAEHAAHVLSASDNVEILQFVGGG